MFVPHGWWHAVINLETTVAVTQNFVPALHFDEVWQITKRKRAFMLNTWYRGLEAHRPEFAAAAQRLGYIPPVQPASDALCGISAERKQMTTPTVRGSGGTHVQLKKMFQDADEDGFDCLSTQEVAAVLECYYKARGVERSPDQVVEEVDEVRRRQTGSKHADGEVASSLSAEMGQVLGKILMWSSSRRKFMI